ncbi:hypothetical protein Golomagni_04023 [Golovinomyces magnicellulatus]|nr:hypothetical protein Golomagni_04023 [Golovinomyces magnicellulatus]
MDIDGGRKGLENSLWNHNVARTTGPTTTVGNDAQPARNRPEINTNCPNKRAILKLVSKEHRARVWELLQPLTRASPDPHPTALLQETLTTITTNAVKAVTANLQGLWQKTPVTKPTYANIAAKPTPRRPEPPLPGKPVSPYLHQEVIISYNHQRTEFTNRTPTDIVTATDKALHATRTKAARRLPSGDIRLIFHNDCRDLLQNTSWVQLAFGPEATLNQTKYAVVAKGIRRSQLPQDTSLLHSTLSAENHIQITEAKPMQTRNQNGERTNLLLYLHNIDHANHLCLLGLAHKAELFNCEPYLETARAQRCFKCHKWEHTAKRCHNTSRCGRCAALAHPSGETCPAESGQAPTKCLNCNGNHPAWALTCPTYLHQQNRATEAYAWRPRRFHDNTRDPRAYPVPTPPSPQTTSEPNPLPPPETRRRPGRPPERTPDPGQGPRRTRHDSPTRIPLMRVLSWNIAKNPSTHSIALHSPLQPDILAIQEPAYIGTPRNPPCPGSAPYHLFHNHGRIATYIHKRHALAHWTIVSKPDICSLSNSKLNIRFIHVYNPPPGPNATDTIRQLADFPAGPDTIITGDFNLHHPLWDYHERTTPNSALLLQEVERLQLGLVTPFASITRCRAGDRASTIDLIWASTSLKAQYQIPQDPTLAGSDHFPQLVEIPLTQHTPAKVATPRWHDMDPALVQAEAANALSQIQLQLSSPESIDNTLEQIHNALHRVISATIPHRTPRLGPRNGWMTAAAKTASKQAKLAARRLSQRPSPDRQQVYTEAVQTRDRIIAKAKRQTWRTFLANTAAHPNQLWRTAKWAKLHAQGLGPEPIPALTRPGLADAVTHTHKGQALAQVFFPAPKSLEPPDLDPASIPTRPIDETTLLGPVTMEEVASTIHGAAPWNAPGPDGIPYGFLKACGTPLALTLSQVFTACLATGHFPTRYRHGHTVVLRKLNKTPTELRTPKGWRPITLLNTIGKTLEKILAQRIGLEAESKGTLPEGQMGNRPSRSTETAVLLLSETVQAAWARAGTASLLLLDIASAFDSVDHQVLLLVLKRLGFPTLALSLIQSFLSNRTTRLRFDGESTPEINIMTGVPQGSPLSPILFSHLIGTLYFALASVPGLITIGYADDTNLISIGRNSESTSRQLEEGWRTCITWATRFRLDFNGAKSELIHFSKTRQPPDTSVRLGPDQIPPKASVKFLGVTIDRKLTWKPHITEVLKKARRNIYGLTRTTAMTWGPRLDAARELYLIGLRPVLTYNLLAFFTPTKANHTPTTQTRAFAAFQTDCLRTIAGAFRATPQHQLEAEVAVPPIDIYMTSRAAKALGRLDTGPAPGLIHSAHRDVARRLPQRRHARRKYRRPLQEIRQKVQDSGFDPTWDRKDAASYTSDQWTRRWEHLESLRLQRNARPTCYPAQCPRILRPGRPPDFHQGLPKHLSSILIQCRTGKIGLRAFLFHRGVPDILTPLCQCGTGPEDIYHLALRCPELQRPPLQPPITTERDIRRCLSDSTQAPAFARWLVRTNRLSYFTVAQRIEQDTQPGDGTGHTRTQDN